LSDKFTKINEAQNAWFNQIKQENHKKYEKLHALLFFYNLYEDRLEGRSEFDILYILTKGKIRRIKDLESKYLLKKYGKKNNSMNGKAEGLCAE